MQYNPSNWYWIVGGSTSQVYSSAVAAYVPTTDDAYVDWIAAGGRATRIDSESDLQEVFATQYPAGWPSVALKAAAQSALDSSDITMLRIAEAVALATNSWTGADVVAWVAYRRDLRAVIDGSSTSLPTKPAYPAGT